MKKHSFFSSYLFVIITIFILIIGLWIIYFLFIHKYIPELADQGLFGDSFGALNTLFTGLAFAGVIISLILQKKELELQRKELELTRIELSKSAESQESLSSSNRKQVIFLEKTARLNALTASLEFWINKKDKDMNFLERQTIEFSIEKTHERIDNILAQLDKMQKLELGGD